MYRESSIPKCMINRHSIMCLLLQMCVLKLRHLNVVQTYTHIYTHRVLYTHNSLHINVICVVHLVSCCHWVIFRQSHNFYTSISNILSHSFHFIHLIYTCFIHLVVQLYHLLCASDTLFISSAHKLHKWRFVYRR